MARKPVDIALLHKLWAGGVHQVEICRQLGISHSCVLRLAKEHHIPRRAYRHPFSREEPEAPTPEDAQASEAGLALAPSVEARARECRESHYARRRNESWEETQRRLARAS